jgi:acyl-CoA thioester hydrolase
MIVDVPVRWQDLDALGHVSHAVYLTYFEEQRDQWLFDRVGLRGHDYVVVSVQVDYDKPIDVEDGPVRVSSTVERLGRSSITLAGELRSARGVVCARSLTSIVLWDAIQRCSRGLTIEECAALAADLRPALRPAPPTVGDPVTAVKADHQGVKRVHPAERPSSLHRTGRQVDSDEDR